MFFMQKNKGFFLLRSPHPVSPRMDVLRCATPSTNHAQVHGKKVLKAHTWSWKEWSESQTWSDPQFEKTGFCGWRKGIMNVKDQKQKVPTNAAWVIFMSLEHYKNASQESNDPSSNKELPILQCAMSFLSHFLHLKMRIIIR